MVNITYFSRMINSERFAELATGEVARRGFLHVRHACAVADGAEWIQDFIAAHRADAVRILDFYHAASYLSDIAGHVRNAGTTLPESWLEEQLHELKHQGPKKVLEEIHRLLKDHSQIEDIKKFVNYLQKREKMMHYPGFRAQGWPIGSGSVESANTHVVQSRMDGPGMHWESRNVNPMLALRTGECNDRWEETRNQAFRHRLAERQSSRLARQKKRYEQIQQNVKKTMLRILFLSSLHQPKTKEISVPSSQADPVSSSPCASHTKKTCRPAPSHPWRRYSHAKK